MNEAAVVRTTRRRFWLCIASVFFGGLVCGCIIGGYGLRYLFLHYPPPIERIANRISKKVQLDFKLDDNTRDSIRKEIITMVVASHGKLSVARNDARTIIEQHTEAIAEMMPDDASRDRWRQESKKYIPFPPPLPPPPIPPADSQ